MSRFHKPEVFPAVARKALLVFCGATVMLCLLGHAFAQGTHSPNLTLTCTPTNITPPQTVVCKAQISPTATGAVSMGTSSADAIAVQPDWTGAATEANVLVSAAAGPHIFTASYSGDNYYAAASASVTLTASTGAMPSSMLMTCAPTDPSNLQAATCGAQVAPGSTGYVAFNTSAFHAFAPINASGQAIINTEFVGLPYGIYSVTAGYGGDSTYNASSGGTTVAVNSATPTSETLPSQMTVTCTPSTLVSPQTGVCKAQVPAGAKGTVTFSYWQNQVSLPVDGIGSTTASNLFIGSAAGNYTVTANYSGDAAYAASSATTSVTVQQAGTTAPNIAMGCGSPINLDGSSTCEAWVAQGATGYITFWSSVTGRTIAEPIDASGYAIAPNEIGNAPAGSYYVVAAYGGDQTYAGAWTFVSVTAGDTGKTTTHMDLSCSPTSLVSPGTLTCTAQLQPGATGNVIIALDRTWIGVVPVDAQGHASLSTSVSVNPGNHLVAAHYLGDSNFTVADIAVPLLDQTVPTITWNPPAPITYGAPLSATQLNATANVPGTFVYTPAAGTVVASGTQTLSVTFTPTDTTDYTTATATVTLTVGPSGAGIIHTIAGDGVAGYTGNGGLAIDANINSPGGTVVDAGGNVFFVDGLNNVIRKVTAATGNISAVVDANGTIGYSGDGGPAINAEINAPSGVAIDASGNLYIADQQDCVIRKVTASTGYISTVVGIPPSGGNAYCGYNGDGISAIAAKLNEPAGLAVDAAGNIYIADFGNYRVRMVTASTGNISTVAGNGTRGNSGSDGDGGLATSAQLWGAVGLAVDGVGNIYIADEFSDRIRKVTSSSGDITTVAGTGSAGYNGDDIPASSAELNVPLAVSVDSSGNLYVADDANNRVRIVTASSGTISTAAGGGTGCPQQTDNAGDGCPATSAELRSPGGVTVDASGNLYIADSGDARVRMVGSNANPTLTLATSGSPSVYTGSVTFTATLSGALTGTVSFYDGGTSIGTGTISGTKATYTTATLTPGTHSITASYNSVTSNTISQTVNKATPVITWATPAAIFYGTTLGPAQLNASSNVLGTFVYSPASGTVPALGSDTLSVTFTATDTTDFTPVTATVPLVVYQATPAISWPPPANIPYGTALSSTQLDATSNIPGTFVYSPAVGTVLSVGPHTLTAIFTPTDTTDYGNITATTYITVTDGMSKWDAGTVTLIVNGSTVATASYGQSSTPTTIAAALMSNLSAGSPVNVIDVDDTLYLEAKTPGAASNSITYSLQNVGYDSTDFSQPSFPISAETGNLEGGADQGSNSGQQVYSYQIPSGGYDGVGNLRGVVDSVMGTWTFTPDMLNRLAGATANQPGNPSTNYCWGYDLFGNRTIQAGSSAAFEAGSPTCTPASGASLRSTWANFNAKNQITSATQSPGGLAYDAAGGVINDGVSQYLYDGEGRICAVASSGSAMTGYIYNASGQRVAKGTINAWSCDPSVNGFHATNDYILGQAGEQATEMGMGANNSMAWQHTNVYAAGKLLTTYDNNGLHFYLNDPVGTRRAQTDYAGVLEQTCSSLPFGDGLVCTDSTQYPTEHHFTGKERDSESGLDYFGARYYASAMGRFMSPDWSANPTAVPYANLQNPQSLNLYGYVNNNPLARTDADGHFWRELWNNLRTGCGCWTRDFGTAELRAHSNYMANEFLDHPPGTPPGTHYRVSIQIVYPFFPMFGGGLGGGEESSGEGAAPTTDAGWVRVGRWMTQEELDNMRATETAQEPYSGGPSRVAEPASPDAYKDAPAGHVYVEYDVPAGSTKPDGTGWSRIPGPNSPEGRLAARNGQPAPEMPPVRNIEVKGSK